VGNLVEVDILDIVGAVVVLNLQGLVVASGRAIMRVTTFHMLEVEHRGSSGM